MTPIVYQKALILAYNYKITFVKSQHTETTNTKGYFIVKKGSKRQFQRFLIFINNKDSDLVLQTKSE